MVTQTEYIKYLLEKYTRYVENIKWHVKTNKPALPEESTCRHRIKCYEEIIDDLQKLTPSK